MCVTTFHCARFFHLSSYEKEGRLTVTDHSQNLSRTYEGPTNIIPAFLSTDFSIGDHIHVGGLPDGAMVSKFCYNSWTIATISRKDFENGSKLLLIFFWPSTWTRFSFVA